MRTLPMFVPNTRACKNCKHSSDIYSVEYPSLTHRLGVSIRTMVVGQDRALFEIEDFMAGYCLCHWWASDDPRRVRNDHWCGQFKSDYDKFGPLGIPEHYLDQIVLCKFDPVSEEKS